MMDTNTKRDIPEWLKVAQEKGETDIVELIDKQLAELGEAE
jgi:hypothetical protein